MTGSDSYGAEVGSGAAYGRPKVGHRETTNPTVEPASTTATTTGVGTPAPLRTVAPKKRTTAVTTDSGEWGSISQFCAFHSVNRICG